MAAGGGGMQFGDARGDHDDGSFGSLTFLTSKGSRSRIAAATPLRGKHSARRVYSGLYPEPGGLGADDPPAPFEVLEPGALRERGDDMGRVHAGRW
jgi:hypothetical protein